MGKVGQMVLEIQKEWMKQINEKNEIIKDLEERLERGEYHMVKCLQIVTKSHEKITNHTNICEELS